MTPSFRIVNQFALPVAIATAAVLVLTPIHAEDKATAPEVGPTSAIVLEDAQGETVKLSLDDGHISWGESPQKRIFSTGYVFIGKPLAALLTGEAFQEENRELELEVNEALQAIAAQMQEIQGRLEGLTPDDEEFARSREEGQALFQQRQSLIEQATAAQAMLRARQVEEAYRELVEAVNVVADRLEIDVVERFIPTDDEFDIAPGAGALNAAMLQIRLRSVLRYPEDSDITDEVMEELGLP